LHTTDAAKPKIDQQIISQPAKRSSIVLVLVMVLVKQRAHCDHKEVLLMLLLLLTTRTISMH